MKNLLTIFKRQTKVEDFEALLQPHLDTLYNQAYRYTGSSHDAEDLLQDLLLETYRKRDKLLGVKNVGGWLNRCLYHRFIDRYRSARSKPDFDDIQNPELENQLIGDHLDENHYFAAQIHQNLALLSENQRAAINLHDYCGYSLLEISDIMDMPTGTLKSHLHRGRKRLQKSLQLKPEMLASALTHRG